jgi:hypothetical protein
MIKLRLTPADDHALAPAGIRVLIERLPYLSLHRLTLFI